MVLQQVVILALFLGALFYLGSLFYKQFFSKSSTGCGGTCSCSAVDLKRIEREINESMKVKSVTKNHS